MSGENATEYADKRTGADRREGYCPLHEERDKDIKEIKDTIVVKLSPALNQQVGQWKVFMWGASIVSGILVSALIGFGAFIYSYQQETRGMVDPLLTYVVKHGGESERGFEMIEDVTAMAKKNKQDIHTNTDDIAEIRLILKSMDDGNGRVAP